mgnify:FL=1
MESILNIVISEEDKKKIKELKELLEGVVETLDIILDEEALKAILEAEEDIRKGRVRRLEEFLNELKEAT